MKRLWAIIPILVLGLLVLVFAAHSLRRSTSQVTPVAMVGKPLPAISLPPLAGGPPAPLRAVAKGPVLINFYASWCAPCIQEAPALMALKAEGVRVVGIAYKDAPADSAAFLTRYGDPFAQVVTDRDGRAGLEFGLTGVPETYAIDAAGVIRAKHAGPMDAADAEAMLKKAGL
ncbi:MAG TPA: DsbE family thiol:disulfide interchange protein [Caulobacteraceae bacterium]|nr:DsbE family thiol:disulfide interchange protein [Caulobacteraceae bacterium]